MAAAQVDDEVIGDSELGELRSGWSSPQILATYHTRSAVDAAVLGASKPALRWSQQNSHVEDRLLEYNRQCLARRMAEARQREREIMKEVRAPKLNKVSVNIASSHQKAPVVDRLSSTPKVSKGDRGATEQNNFVPCITPAANSLKNRGVYATFQWEKEREARLEQSRRVHLRHEKRELRGAPALDPMSRLIALTTRSDGGKPIEDSLRSRQEVISAKLEALRNEELQEAKAMARSTQTGDATAASQRLFAEAAVREAQREEKTREMELLDCIDPATGQVRFHPAINTCVVPTSRADRSARRQPAVNETVEISHNPYVSEYSRLLAELRHERQQSASPAFRADPQADYPMFAPQIDGKSATLAAKTPSGKTRADLLLARQEQYNAHRRRLAHTKDLQEMVGCTFSPYVPRSSCPGANGNPSDPFLERNARWKSKLSKVLENQRQLKREHENDGCTFRPRVN